MVETLSELLENAANVAEDNGGKATKLLTEDADNC